MGQQNLSFAESGSGLSRRGFLFSVVSLFLAGRALRGDQEATLSVDVKVVNLLATVRNNQGQIVRSLSQEDFLLEEDGRSFLSFLDHRYPTARKFSKGFPRKQEEVFLKFPRTSLSKKFMIVLKRNSAISIALATLLTELMQARVITGFTS